MNRDYRQLLIGACQDDVGLDALVDWVQENLPRDEKREPLFAWQYQTIWSCRYNYNRKSTKNNFDYLLINEDVPKIAPWLKTQFKDWFDSLKEDLLWLNCTFMIQHGFVTQWKPLFHSTDNYQEQNQEHTEKVKWLFENHPIRHVSLLGPSPKTFQHATDDGDFPVPIVGGFADEISIWDGTTWNNFRMSPEIIYAKPVFGFTKKQIGEALWNELIGLHENNKLCYPKVTHTNNRINFPSIADAQAALDLAALRIGRRLAGLPVPEPTPE